MSRFFYEHFSGCFVGGVSGSRRPFFIHTLRGVFLLSKGGKNDEKRKSDENKSV